MSTTEMPSTFACDCCGEPTPLVQAVKPYDDRTVNEICLDCERSLLQAALGEIDAATAMLKASVAAALSLMAPADVTTLVMEAVVDHARDLRPVETRDQFLRWNHRNLARRSGIVD